MSRREDDWPERPATPQTRVVSAKKRQGLASVPGRRQFVRENIKNKKREEEKR